MNSRLDALPTTPADLAAGITPTEADVNRIQSAEIQQMLARGEITPEQVAAWRRAQATKSAVVSIPATMEMSAPPPPFALAATDTAMIEAPSAPSEGITPTPPQADEPNAPAGGMPTSGAGSGGDVAGPRAAVDTSASEPQQKN